MANPTGVNSQITDAVTQANVKVLGDSPALAMGNLYKSITHSLAIAAENGVSAQQQANTIYQAASSSGITLLYPFDTSGKQVEDADVEKYLEGMLEEHRKSKGE